eukprot:TRINITY_DN891_c0_g1_i1.p1 TRINITY_DN891_c0_g1~~TRINITY_DN891_c0_g1_i1.p1  ORF type:complete len:451 (+),score=172.36 TRINITY_DN891_c0_g1_i1:119-1471(+)
MATTITLGKAPADFPKDAALGKMPSNFIADKEIEAIGLYYQRALQPLSDTPTVVVEEEEGGLYGTDISKEELEKAWKLTADNTYYELLNIPLESDEDVITAAYKRAVIIQHPDKKPAKDDHERKLNSELFDLITKARDTLLDQKQRRDYDSTIEIDDSIPSKSAGKGDKFYKVYGEAFKKNERWSEIKPVPQLGGPDATEDEVEDFYSFWFNFKSWREFPQFDEHRPDEAGDRGERRWMEQENKRIRKKKKTEENARIRKLVENAEASDPRMIAFKAPWTDEELDSLANVLDQFSDVKDKERFSKIKAALGTKRSEKSIRNALKKAERRKRDSDRLKAEKAAEEAAKAEAEAKAKAEEDAKLAKKKEKAAKEQAKKNLRRARQRLRKACLTLPEHDPNGHLANSVTVEFLCAELVLEPLTAVCKLVEESDGTKDTITAIVEAEAARVRGE